MSQRSKKARLQISEEEAKYLQKIAQSRTEPQREVQRARILMKYLAGESITGIQETLKISRPSVYQSVGYGLGSCIEG